MKTEVYSGRLSAAVKTQLEVEARRRKVPISKLLDEYVRQGLSRRRISQIDDEEEQARLHAEFDKFSGSIAGNNPLRSQQVRELVRARLMKKNGRTRSN